MKVAHGAVGLQCEHGGLTGEPAAPADDSDPCLIHFRCDIRALGGRKPQNPLVHDGEIDADLAGDWRLAVDAYAEGAAVLGAQDHPGSGDECLAGHAVGQDSRAPEAVSVDDRDLCP